MQPGGDESAGKRANQTRPREHFSENGVRITQRQSVNLIEKFWSPDAKGPDGENLRRVTPGQQIVPAIEEKIGVFPPLRLGMPDTSPRQAVRFAAKRFAEH